MRKSLETSKTLALLNYSNVYCFSAAAAGGTKQKFLFFFGAPGVGKGTYAKLLARDLKYNHISTGDEIRKILKKPEQSTLDKNLIKEIRDIVNSGKLVNDDIVLNIIREKVKEPASALGVLIDGFPRTVPQLKKYEENLPTHLVLNVYLEYSILLEKLMGRRTCNNCGASYNICSIKRNGYDMEPLLQKKDGVCDFCGCTDPLVIRSDDTETVISARMKEYEEKTAPILDIYKKRSALFNFEPRKGVKDYPKFFQEVKPLIDRI